MRVAVGISSCSNSSRLDIDLNIEFGDTSEVTTGPVKPSNETDRKRVHPPSKTIGMVVVTAWPRARRGRGSGNHRHLTTDQIARHRRQPIIWLSAQRYSIATLLALDE